MPQEITATRHAEVRIQQRGLHNTKLRILLDESSRYSHDARIFTGKDKERYISSLKRKIEHHKRHGSLEAVSELKREIQLAEGLVGWKTVIADGKLITCYPLTGARGRRKRNRKRRQGKPL